MNTNNPAGYQYMMSTVLPRIEKLARDLPIQGIDILKAGRNGQVELSKLHIAQILASGFFCIFKDVGLPSINFDKYEKKSAYTLLILFHTKIGVGYTALMDLTVNIAKIREKS